jgi:HEPN domain-containing protein
MMKQYALSCYEVEDYARCGLHILLARHAGHPDWRHLFNECLLRLESNRSLVLKDTVDIDGEHKTPQDFRSRVFETNDRVIRLHETATNNWKRRLVEISGTVEALLMPMLRQLLLLETTYERIPDLGIVDLSELVENAMKVAELKFDENNVEMGLTLLYAQTQPLLEIPLPGSEKICTFLLNALERTKDDPRLRVSGYKHFDCSFIYRLTDEILLNSSKNAVISDELKLDLFIEATGLPTIT